MFVDRPAEFSELKASYNDKGSDADKDLTTWCAVGCFCLHCLPYLPAYLAQHYQLFTDDPQCERLPAGYGGSSLWSVTPTYIMLYLQF
jgi:hypothetical protein